MEREERECQSTGMSRPSVIALGDAIPNAAIWECSGAASPSPLNIVLSHDLTIVLLGVLTWEMKVGPKHLCTHVHRQPYSKIKVAFFFFLSRNNPYPHQLTDRDDVFCPLNCAL